MGRGCKHRPVCLSTMQDSCRLEPPWFWVLIGIPSMRNVGHTIQPFIPMDPLFTFVTFGLQVSIFCFALVASLSTSLLPWLGPSLPVPRSLDRRSIDPPTVHQRSTNGPYTRPPPREFLLPSSFGEKKLSRGRWLDEQGRTTLGRFVWTSIAPSVMERTSYVAGARNEQ